MQLKCGSEISIIISNTHIANGIVEAVDGQPLVENRIPTCHGDDCVEGTVIVRNIMPIKEEYLTFILPSPGLLGESENADETLQGIGKNGRWLFAKKFVHLPVSQSSSSPQGDNEKESSDESDGSSESGYSSESESEAEDSSEEPPLKQQKPETERMVASKFNSKKQPYPVRFSFTVEDNKIIMVFDITGAHYKQNAGRLPIGSDVLLERDIFDVYDFNCD
jgi:hypothetical protein